MQEVLKKSFKFPKVTLKKQLSGINNHILFLHTLVPMKNQTSAM